MEKYEGKDNPPGLFWIVPDLIGYTDIEGEFVTGIISENKKGKIHRIERRLQKFKGLMKMEIVPGYNGISPNPKRWELLIIAEKDSSLIKELENISQIERDLENKDFVSRIGEYENFSINVNGIEILARYCPNWGGDIAHMEFRGISKEAIPISTSNYKSHFIVNPDNISKIGTPEEYAIAYCLAVIEINNTREPSIEEIIEANRKNKVIEFPKYSESEDNSIAS